jgi:hypothetical protein
MNAENLARLEAIQSTVVSDGWKFLMEDIEDKLKAIKEEFTSPQVNLELLRFGQGRITVYKELLSLEAIVNAAIDQSKETVDE